MPVRRPTPSQLRDVADYLGITLTDADLDSFLGLAADVIDDGGECP
jgi:hypothetical protein